MPTQKQKMIYLVAGARPNFMKIAPIIRAIQTRADVLSYKLIHTDQHYDKAMSQVFFDELGIPEPDYHLGCGGGTHAEQTAKIMVEFEKVCVAQKPDCVLVVGDVNSTLACAIVAKKLCIKVAHVEAGLRSGDLSMPEEINRLVTDSISDFFFVTEPSGKEFLLREGKSEGKIWEVGHVMIDNLLYQYRQLDAVRSKLSSEKLKRKLGSYGVLTLHRPSNVDSELSLRKLFEAINLVAEKLPLIFPAHPRTKNNLEKWNISISTNIVVTTPMTYMEFLNTWSDAVVVLTDSGGLQEETTGLGVPCITLRDTTERPITVDVGSNYLTGVDSESIQACLEEILSGLRKGHVPSLWDGSSANRIIDVLARDL